MNTEDAQIQYNISLMMRNGWRVQSTDPTGGVHFIKPKKLNTPLMVIGLFGIIIIGLGLILILIAFLLYVMDSDKVRYMSRLELLHFPRRPPTP